MPLIADEVQRFRLLPLAARTRHLQELIGHPSNDPAVLQWRALLVTALREADLWPYA